MGTTEYGYLGLDYLGYPYLAGTIDAFYGMQINQVISARVNAGMSVLANAQNSPHVGSQANMIVGGSPNVGQQVNQTIGANVNKGQQVSAFVNNRAKLTGMQTRMFKTDSRKNMGMEVKADTLRHRMVGIYLSWPYLAEPYLSEKMQALMGMQIEAIAFLQSNYGMQAEMHVTKTKQVSMQIHATVNTDRHKGFQVMAVQREKVGMQATMVIYNIERLRFMYTFPSRGIASMNGINWTTTSQAPGDYSVNNVNTDVIEEQYRSIVGDVSGVSLTCDTGVTQGVQVDTIAILGHNFSRSAQVQVQGSNDNFATSPNITFNMTVEDENMYYIAPTFPPFSGQNRYWRFIIDDPTNPDGYLSVGTILFGTSEIFSIKENFTNPLQFGYKHFKDAIDTEGFTADTNDRALKRSLRLNFDKLRFFEPNFTKLNNFTKYARTGLKALVIPTPKTPSQFAVYAKLTSMPLPDVYSLGDYESYASLTLEWDEAL